MTRFLAIANAAGLLATIASTLASYPHCLAYSNEAAGGPLNTYKHLLHRRFDDRQNLLNVKEWIASHPEARLLNGSLQSRYDDTIVVK